MHNTHLKGFLKHKVLAPCQEFLTLYIWGDTWQFTLLISSLVGTLVLQQFHCERCCLWEPLNCSVTYFLLWLFIHIACWCESPSFHYSLEKKDLAHLFTIHCFQAITLVPGFLQPVLVGPFKYSYSVLAAVFLKQCFVCSLSYKHL